MSNVDSTSTGVELSATGAPTFQVSHEPRIFKGDDAYSIYGTQTRFLLGKVLTVIDASYSDREQRKAVKDLVKQQFHAQEKYVRSILAGDNSTCSMGMDGDASNG